MTPMISCCAFLTTGLPPTVMADVVADRLSRLDKLVAAIEVQVFMCPGTASPLDEMNWSAPMSPGDGESRVVHVVRPHLLDESIATASQQSIKTAFSPGRAVRFAGISPRSGRAVYMIDEVPISAGTYTHVPIVQFLDLQIHESWVPGLNLLSLLRDHPAQLVGWNGDVSTYELTLQSALTPPGAWVEHYDFDVNSRGAPVRFRARVETDSGFVFEREIRATAMEELNGAELVTGAIAISWNSNADNYEIDRFVVCTAEIDQNLSEADILIEPEQRNSVIWTRPWPIDRSNPMHFQEYDEDGQMVAGVANSNKNTARHRAFLPAILACGLAGALCIAFVSSAKFRRSERV